MVKMNLPVGKNLSTEARVCKIFKMTLAELRHFYRYRNHSVRQLQSQISPLVPGTVLAFTGFCVLFVKILWKNGTVQGIN